MKKNGILFFALGVIAGLLGNLGARKIRNIEILGADLFENIDEDDWD